MKQIISLIDLILIRSNQSHQSDYRTVAEPGAIMYRCYCTTDTVASNPYKLPRTANIRVLGISSCIIITTSCSDNSTDNGRRYVLTSHYDRLGPCLSLTDSTPNHNANLLPLEEGLNQFSVPFVSRTTPNPGPLFANSLLNRTLVCKDDF